MVVRYNESNKGDEMGFVRSTDSIARLETELDRSRRDHREVFDAALELQQQRDVLLALCDGVERALQQSDDTRPRAISIDQIRDILKPIR